VTHELKDFAPALFHQLVQLLSLIRVSALDSPENLPDQDGLSPFQLRSETLHIQGATAVDVFLKQLKLYTLHPLRNQNLRVLAQVEQEKEQ
jgi:hypothetical protein